MGARFAFVGFVSFVVNNPDLCEIRVPTYRRPEWLRRALRSLIDQTHRDWLAIVMDDSPDGEGDAVVRELADGRIRYRRNERQLGAAGNIDQAFSTGPLQGGAFACVVEDDNWLLPRFVEDNIRVLREIGCAVLMRNQRIHREVTGGTETTHSTTRGHLLSEGIVRPRLLHSLLLVGEGVSNGGLFWGTDARSVLEVGPLVADSLLQEHCRTLQIDEDIYFSSEPLAVWTDVIGPFEKRAPCAKRALSRGRQSLHRWLMVRYGEDILPEIEVVARRAGYARKLEESLAYMGIRHPGVPLGRFLKCRVKSAIRALTTPDPLDAYMKRVRARASWESGGAGVAP